MVDNSIRVQLGLGKDRLQVLGDLEMFVRQRFERLGLNALEVDQYKVLA